MSQSNQNSSNIMDPVSDDDDDVLMGSQSQLSESDHPNFNECTNGNNSESEQCQNDINANNINDIDNDHSQNHSFNHEDIDEIVNGENDSDSLKDFNKVQEIQISNNLNVDHNNCNNQVLSTPILSMNSCQLKPNVAERGDFSNSFMTNSNTFNSQYQNPKIGPTRCNFNDINSSTGPGNFNSKQTQSPHCENNNNNLTNFDSINSLNSLTTDVSCREHPLRSSVDLRASSSLIQGVNNSLNGQKNNLSPCLKNQLSQSITNNNSLQQSQLPQLQGNTNQHFSQAAAAKQSMSMSMSMAAASLSMSMSSSTTKPALTLRDQWCVGEFGRPIARSEQLYYDSLNEERSESDEDEESKNRYMLQIGSSSSSRGGGGGDADSGGDMQDLQIQQSQNQQQNHVLKQDLNSISQDLKSDSIVDTTNDLEGTEQKTNKDENEQQDQIQLTNAKNLNESPTIALSTNQRQNNDTNQTQSISNTLTQTVLTTPVLNQKNSNPNSKPESNNNSANISTTTNICESPPDPRTKKMLRFNHGGPQGQYSIANTVLSVNTNFNNTTILGPGPNNNTNIMSQSYLNKLSTATNQDFINNHIVNNNINSNSNQNSNNSTNVSFLPPTTMLQSSVPTTVSGPSSNSIENHQYNSSGDTNQHDQSIQSMTMSISMSMSQKSLSQQLQQNYNSIHHHNQGEENRHHGPGSNMNSQSLSQDILKQNANNDLSNQNHHSHCQNYHNHNHHSDTPSYILASPPNLLPSPIENQDQDNDHDIDPYGLSPPPNSNLNTGNQQQNLLLDSPNFKDTNNQNQICHIEQEERDINKFNLNDINKSSSPNIVPSIEMMPTVMAESIVERLIASQKESGNLTPGRQYQRNSGGSGVNVSTMSQSPTSVKVLNHGQKRSNIGGSSIGNNNINQQLPQLLQPVLSVDNNNSESQELQSVNNNVTSNDIMIEPIQVVNHESVLNDNQSESKHLEKQQISTLLNDNHNESVNDNFKSDVNHNVNDNHIIDVVNTLSDDFNIQMDNNLNDYQYDIDLENDDIPRTPPMSVRRKNRSCRQSRQSSLRPVLESSQEDKTSTELQLLQQQSKFGRGNIIPGSQIGPLSSYSGGNFTSGNTNGILNGSSNQNLLNCSQSANIHNSMNMSMNMNNHNNHGQNSSTILKASTNQLSSSIIASSQSSNFKNSISMQKNSQVRKILNSVSTGSLPLANSIKYNYSSPGPNPQNSMNSSSTLANHFFQAKPKLYSTLSNTKSESQTPQSDNFNLESSDSVKVLNSDNVNNLNYTVNSSDGQNLKRNLLRDKSAPSILMAAMQQNTNEPNSMSMSSETSDKLLNLNDSRQTTNPIILSSVAKNTVKGVFRKFSMNNNLKTSSLLGESLEDNDIKNVKKVEEETVVTVLKQDADSNDIDDTTVNADSNSDIYETVTATTELVPGMKENESQIQKQIMSKDLDLVIPNSQNESESILNDNITNHDNQVTVQNSNYLSMNRSASRSEIPLEKQTNQNDTTAISETANVEVDHTDDSKICQVDEINVMQDDNSIQQFHEEDNQAFKSVSNLNNIMDKDLTSQNSNTQSYGYNDNVNVNDTNSIGQCDSVNLTNSNNLNETPSNGNNLHSCSVLFGSVLGSVRDYMNDSLILDEVNNTNNKSSGPEAAPGNQISCNNTLTNNYVANATESVQIDVSQSQKSYCSALNDHRLSKDIIASFESQNHNNSGSIEDIKIEDVDSNVDGKTETLTQNNSKTLGTVSNCSANSVPNTPNIMGSQAHNPLLFPAQINQTKRNLSANSNTNTITSITDQSPHIIPQSIMLGPLSMVQTQTTLMNNINQNGPGLGLMSQQQSQIQEINYTNHVQCHQSNLNSTMGQMQTQSQTLDETMELDDIKILASQEKKSSEMTNNINKDSDNLNENVKKTSFDTVNSDLNMNNNSENNKEPTRLPQDSNGNASNENTTLNVGVSEIKINKTNETVTQSENDFGNPQLNEQNLSKLSQHYDGQNDIQGNIQSESQNNTQSKPIINQIQNQALSLNNNIFLPTATMKLHAFLAHKQKSNLSDAYFHLKHNINSNTMHSHANYHDNLSTHMNQNVSDNQNQIHNVSNNMIIDINERLSLQLLSKQLQQEKQQLEISLLRQIDEKDGILIQISKEKEQLSLNYQQVCEELVEKKRKLVYEMKEWELERKRLKHQVDEKTKEIDNLNKKKQTWSINSNLMSSNNISTTVNNCSALQQSQCTQISSSNQNNVSSNLGSTNFDSNQNFQNAEKKLKKITLEKCKLSADKERIKVERDNLKSQLDAADKKRLQQLDTLKKEITSLKRDLADQKRIHNDTLSQNLEKSNQYTDQVFKLNSNLEESHKKCEQSQQHIVELKKQLNNFQSENQELQRKLERGRRDLVEIESLHVKQAQQEAQQSNQMISDFKLKIEEMEANTLECNAKLLKCEEEKSRIGQVLGEKDKEVQPLKEEIRKLQSINQQLMKEKNDTISEYTHKFNILEERSENERRDFDTILLRKIKEKEQDNLELLEKLKDENQILRQENEKLTYENTNLSSMSSSQQATTVTDSEAQRRFKEKEEYLAVQSRRKDEEISNIKVELSRLREEKFDLTIKCTELETNLREKEQLQMKSKQFNPSQSESSDSSSDNLLIQQKLFEYEKKSKILDEDMQNFFMMKTRFLTEQMQQQKSNHSNCNSTTTSEENDFVQQLLSESQSVMEKMASQVKELTEFKQTRLQIDEEKFQKSKTLGKNFNQNQSQNLYHSNSQHVNPSSTNTGNSTNMMMMMSSNSQSSKSLNAKKNQIQSQNQRAVTGNTNTNSTVSSKLVQDTNSWDSMQKGLHNLKARLNVASAATDNQNIIKNNSNTVTHTAAPISTPPTYHIAMSDSETNSNDNIVNQCHINNFTNESTNNMSLNNHARAKSKSKLTPPKKINTGSRFRTYDPSVYGN